MSYGSIFYAHASIEAILVLLVVVSAIAPPVHRDLAICLATPEGRGVFLDRARGCEDALEG
jgi:hypothetical protein